MQNKLRATRILQQKTIKELSAASGVSIAHISAIETGKSAPTIPCATKLATALNTTVEDLFGSKTA